MPVGYFIYRQNGRDRIAFNHPAAFGLMVGVLPSFVCGGIRFERERDAKGNLLPLPVWINNVPVHNGTYTGRNGEMMADTDKMDAFDGDFIYEPLL